MNAQRGTSLQKGAGKPPRAQCRASGPSESPGRHISRKALEHFIEAVPVGILRWTMDGRIVDANDRFLSTVGYSREELRAGLVRWTDMTPPEFAERDQEAVAELQLTGRNKPYEKEYVRKDGSRVPVLLSSVVTDERSMSGIAFALDLTEQKQLTHAEAEREAVLLENERLYHEAREANRRQDEFITMLSHELRNPLNAVLGWLTMLKRCLHDPEQRERAIEIIERNVRIQAQLLSDLLDISRLSRGRITLARADVDVTALIQTALETMRPATEEKEIELNASLGEACTVSGDPVRLEQIVWNLLSNALKFTPRRGRIEVAATLSGRWMEITVRDSGAGISPGFLPFIFERFRQEPADAITSESGVGLGLPIVKHLVELHGGTVDAASAGRGQGATFTVRLPAAGAAMQSASARAGIR
jgi:PAS domain S-box-containing protein